MSALRPHRAVALGVAFGAALACARPAAPLAPSTLPHVVRVDTLAPPKADERPIPVQFRLDNGLTVILEENHSAPVVAFQAWVSVGSADETPDEIGLAHVFEHMLFKGTDRRGVGQIAREVEAAGGDINAWTSFDETVYHMVLASRWFDNGLDILADAVQHSSFDPGELDKELKVVLEEIKQGEDSPSRTCGAGALLSHAFRDHPYGRPVIGTAAAVNKITRARLIEFFHKHYIPSNITLIVVGDFETQAALGKIAVAWGSHVAKAPAAAPPSTIPSGPRASRGLPIEKPQTETRAVVTAQDVRETHLSIAFHAPEMHSDDAAALDILAIILGQGESSRLNVDVKRNQQLASEVYAYTHTPRDPGLFVVGATIAGNNAAGGGALPVDVADTERALLTQVYRLGKEEVTNEELAKARTLIESDEVYQKETVQGMARKLGWFATIAGTLDYEAEYQRQVRALTPAKLRASAARWLRPENADDQRRRAGQHRPAGDRGAASSPPSPTTRIARSPRATPICRPASRSPARSSAASCRTASTSSSSATRPCRSSPCARSGKAASATRTNAPTASITCSPCS